MICTAVMSEAPPPASVTEISGFRMLFNAYRQCSDQQEMVVCLKGRALRMLDRAIQMDNIQITDGKRSPERTERPDPIQDFQMFFFFQYYFYKVSVARNYPKNRKPGELAVSFYNRFWDGSAISNGPTASL